MFEFIITLALAALAIWLLVDSGIHAGYTGRYPGYGAVMVSPSYAGWTSERMPRSAHRRRSSSQKVA